MVDLLSNRLEEGIAISVCVISEIYYEYWWLETKREKKKNGSLESDGWNYSRYRASKRIDAVDSILIFPGVPKLDFKLV